MYLFSGTPFFKRNLYWTGHQQSTLTVVITLGAQTVRVWLRNWPHHVIGVIGPGKYNRSDTATSHFFPLNVVNTLQKVYQYYMYEMIQQGVSQRPSTSLSLLVFNDGWDCTLHCRESILREYWEECENALKGGILCELSNCHLLHRSNVISWRKKREKAFFHNKKLTASPCGPLCSTEGKEITWYPFHQQRFLYSLHFFSSSSAFNLLTIHANMYLGWK